MLRIRQKRPSRGVTFAKLQTQALNSKSASISKTTEAAITQKSKSTSRHSRNASATTPNRSSQHPSDQAPKVSNRQRRLASLFMALMASSSLPIETDAETLEAAQKDSIAPKAPTDIKHKRKASTDRVQEIRASRWKRFRYEMGLGSRRKGKARRRDGIDLDDLVELRGEERRKGDDMV
ncbi:uncharacterized protein EKO05_0005848 [Ascochyta rabiei]|uniref:Uncharacterized protein n=1 Tax=Didymella rabiei TaxID=5454 RepID=A0A163IZL9_DIDRA|nr:uncharacterized protein EKO05_0005848 [Ascochyta rabiei]KZM26047.1 hypothetical protein ST47_g2790 [Ascochyta rabiei]UPX15401.1 hypothetical protein EKO05_0005848 [Ascochyta rabiei]